VTASGGDDLEALEASLRRRFRVVDTAVTVADRTISLLHPASAEDLINEQDFERDERLPYWAELWPSARVLGDVVLARTWPTTRVLELGCGAGLVATAAAVAGLDVCATDYYDDALRFTRVNVWRNAARTVETRMIDWRDVPPDLGRFGLVLGSDVLYERPYGALVARAIRVCLADDGRALISDPGRVGREGFLSSLAAEGLRLASRTEHAFVEGPIRQTIVLFEVVRRG
jgi:predicted nicotinamide N-methyase